MKFSLKMPHSMKNNEGFSLVELMVVVAIIGILAALAVPKFQNFQAKARQSEVKNNLSHIYTLEVSYQGDNDTYANLPATGASAGCATTNAIGFTLTDCTKVRYDYNTPAFTTSTFTAQGQNSLASRKINTACTGVTDLWRINETKTLTTPVNAANGC